MLSQVQQHRRRLQKPETVVAARTCWLPRRALSKNIYIPRTAVVFREALALVAGSLFFRNSPSSQTETASDRKPQSAVQTPAADLNRSRRCCLALRSSRDSEC